MTALAQDDGVQRNEWLRGPELHQLVRGRLEVYVSVDTNWLDVKDTYGAEQEQDDGGQATESTRNGTPEDTTGSSDRSVFCLFRHMAGRIKANQDASSSQVRETPVPARRGTGPIVGGHKSFMSRPETPSVGGTNRQPDHVQEEVEHHNAGREPENILEEARRQKVQQSSQGQHDLSADPLHSAELDIPSVRREVDIEHGQLSKHVVDSCLGVAGAESCPGCGTPPSHNETEQPAKSGTTSFGSPEIDRSSRRRRRAHLCNDGGRDEGEDHGDQVAGPVGQVTTGRDTSAESDAHSTDEV